ncbi:hypothetical protein BAE44_0000592 [Dichanthelium oligosanthes]|uniref:Late embryogenesis abundant protein LEA-2 subgroup domain-containing protein n=1 Tax=Dichanthelium oligosanthes TaxID=888268 RepID=A0A1E5WLX4_9POAL|nr:hypothetical protein BAE44_0000592 [Dichanthelium oligosanthes]
MEPDLEAGLTTSRAPGGTVIPLRRHPLEIIIPCTFGVLGTLGIVWLLVCDPLAPCFPTFSVEVAGFDGLDGPAVAAPTLSPAFNLTLHGVSRRHHIGSLELCQERGTVAVSYAGAVLAWGRVPKFCVPAHGQRHVGMVALGADVVLSDELRDRLASERLSRSAELDVDMMLDRQRLLSCRVNLDEPSSQPSPCKVFTGDW